jgi:capsid assembly protease
MIWQHNNHEKDFMKFQHIAARALNRPLLLEPAYSRFFFAALGSRLGFSSLTDVTGQTTLAANLPAQAAGYVDEMDVAARGSYEIDDGVAIIQVSGTLMHKSGYIGSQSGAMGYDWLEAQLEAAIDDPAVLGIMLDIDSGGGEVAGVEDIATKLSNSTKPVWAHANEMAASAAYWLASAADHLVLSNTASVGSIGVLMAHTDYSEAMSTEGIKVTLIHAGAHKVDGNPYEALPDSVKADLQIEIDELRNLFASTVATNRSAAANKAITTAQVLDTEARMYRGQQAVDIGLADEVLSFDDAVAKFSATLANRGVISKGKTMSKPDNNASSAQAGEGNPITAQAHTAAIAAARAEGMAAGASAERTRIADILNHAESEGREATAREFALGTDMDADTAVQIMAKVPKITPAASIDKAAIALDQMGKAQVVATEDAGMAASSGKPGATAAESQLDNNFASMMAKNFGDKK